MVSDDAGRGGRPGLRMASLTPWKVTRRGKESQPGSEPSPGHDKGNGAGTYN
jgi:hypothetical protein